MAETPTVEIPESHRRTPSTPWTPRVRPRPPLEDLVDRDAHPPRRKIETKDRVEDGLHWTSKVALVALVIFWASLPTAGIAWAFFGYTSAMPSLGLAVSSLVVSWRIEAE